MNRDTLIEVIGKHFGVLVSGDRMPDMSGDPRAKIPKHKRPIFDDCCGNAADAILAASTDWRPISTAPTYETVLVAGGDAIYPVTACWDGDRHDGWYVDGQEDTHVEIGWPTHWMPLPTPPAILPQQGEKP